MVRVPQIEGRIRLREKNNLQYVEYIYESWYDREKKQGRNRKAIIGYVFQDYPNAMIPNDNYHRFFNMYTGELRPQQEPDEAEEPLKRREPEEEPENPEPETAGENPGNEEAGEEPETAAGNPESEAPGENPEASERAPEPEMPGTDLKPPAPEESQKDAEEQAD